MSLDCGFNFTPPIHAWTTQDHTYSFKLLVGALQCLLGLLGLHQILQTVIKIESAKWEGRIGGGGGGGGVSCDKRGRRLRISAG